tara:strand:+ start:49 stop:288 length:240 start_codon:yes stop_codon:yes gene_type:complete
MSESIDQQGIRYNSPQNNNKNFMQGSFTSSLNGNPPQGPGFKSANRIGGNLAKAGHSISGFSDASSSRNLKHQGMPISK